MKELKQIDVISTAKVLAVLYAVWGFVIGLFSLLPMAGMFGMSSGTALTGLGLGFTSVIIMPVITAIMGFLLGAISAFLYNIVAKYIGGIKLDI